MSNSIKTMLLSSLAMVAMLSSSCTGEKKDSMEGNPFKEPSTLAFHAPNFSEIKNEHYKPAFEAGINQQREEIKAIVENTEAPTFANTILPYEDSGKLLTRVSNVFFAVSGADGTEEIKAIESEVIPMLTAWRDEITFNQPLFDRIKKVYDNEYETLEGEDKKLLSEIYEGFVRAGANLPEDKKSELEKVNARLAVLEQDFIKMNIDARNNAIVPIETEEELAGLSESEIAQCKADAEAHSNVSTPYAIVITNTTQQPILEKLDNRATREKVYNASYHRSDNTGNQNTYPIIAELAQLRQKKGELLGAANYAEYALKNTMAKTPQTVINFLSKLTEEYLPVAKRETAEIEAYAQKTMGSDFKLQPYDRFYYSAKMKEEKYHFNSDDVKAYFEVDSVLKNGVFYAAERVYGLKFQERFDLPGYHDEVRVFDVLDANSGEQIALFYTDLFRRPTKGGGAWMSEFAVQSHRNNQLPIIYNVCNFTKAPEGQHSLLSWDEVTTLFHEFGHALHGMLSNVNYATLSGTAVLRDFVELPSQFNEYFASVPEIFSHYARHYETGETMPEELKNKMLESVHFHQAYALGENLAASSGDVDFHMLPSQDAINADNVEEYENNALAKYNLLDPQIPPRYRTSYFNHVWGGGYSCGYYSYLWAEVLAVNVSEYFTAHGALNPEVGKAFREKILAKGNTEDLNKIFTDFTGLQEPNVASLLPARGVK